jgi:hypothetical protein
MICMSILYHPEILSQVPFKLVRRAGQFTGFQD